MAVGRFFCVAIPFILTIGAIICILIVLTAGLSSKSLDLFAVDPQNFSISGSALKTLINNNAVDALLGDLSQNVTAKDLGLQNGYQVYVWNYCYQNATGNNATVCTKGAYNWAASALNTTLLQRNISAASIATTGQNVTIPTTITDAVDVFITISRWTQIVYIIALVLTVLELVIGLFAFCSRVVSCLTYFVSGLSTVALIAASGLVTATSAVIVGALNNTVGKYGVTSSLDHRFLAVTWIGVLLSMGGSLFWLFSACCCAADRPHRRNADKEAYTPIHIVNNNGMPPTQSAPYAPGPQRTTGGYEPYRNV
jgi:hypothetical protein